MCTCVHKCARVRINVHVCTLMCTCVHVSGKQTYHLKTKKIPLQLAPHTHWSAESTRTYEEKRDLAGS